MVSARVKWFSPLDDIFGKYSEVEMDRAVTVAEFLDDIRRREPRLDRYIRFAPGDTRPSGLMVLRGAKTLTLADRIEPGDKVDILVGIQGG